MFGINFKRTAMAVHSSLIDEYNQTLKKFIDATYVEETKGQEDLIGCLNSMKSIMIKAAEQNA